MASNNIPVGIIDDAVDEEFDWEAAVREIDVACQSTNPSTSNQDTLFSDSTSLCSKEKKKKPSKQSTLDKFLGNGAVAPKEQSNLEYSDGDQRMSSVEVDAEAAKTWVYPVNIPVRDYQLNITKTALFQNTLVALPTGLGKTLIAAVVMYNYFRWFPDGKIVFAAPSRPLVMQQIEACHNIVGIPQEWTIDMTGQMTPAKRACFWKTKRVFFVTPQVLEKDIRSGTCFVKYLVCLVIDEAHRAMGNYAYCTVVRELMSVPVQLRILALTATPGSKRQTVQHIIDNLCVSTLEYRDENDIDVSKYVHHRKIDVIEVPVGKEAEEINDHICEVIRSYLARLSSIGLIQNRDYKTLSPVDFLNSRDMFRQRPPAELPRINPGEVEACFAALITLYHIRRLLSSHGIRPAYELLQEKLQQGSLKFLSKNENIWKAKSLMQRTISHGAPSPKLSKMLEVLNEHFETKDPKCSRVIIFSNFRGSVRDIMDALAKVGGSVKATEFIGQSSGKTLKGQSQKIQQAVLEKFRTGGYNVIVATSIGEEGLDIMEVDLVICFDANISPLRMIQRMGRTGRKHNGRVVVLACLGSEANGYKKKQASSRAITKHMRNGGKSSFNFHLSPRMIPHFFKPEVQYVEFSIEQFVSRGKKVKDDNGVHTPDFQKNLTADEIDLVAKYFHPSSSNNWRLSLIAFPHCQTYPSRVHNVMHSYRTGILIDMMQHLQGLTLSRGGETFPLEDEVSSGKCIGVETVEPCKNDKEGIFIQGELEGAESLQNIADPEPSSLGTLSSMPHCHSKTPAGHSYLFGCDFVSVDAIGNVQILCLPPLSSTSLKFSKYISASNQVLLDPSVQDSFHLKTPDENYGGHAMPAEAMAEPLTLKQACTRDGAGSFSVSGFCDSDALLEEKLGGVERIIETPVSSRSDTADLEIKESPILAAEDNNNLADTGLSPRLTNLVINGIVPESPISGSGVLDNARRNLDEEFCSEQLKKSSCLQKIETDGGDASLCRRDVPESPVCNEIQTPLLKMNLVTDARGCTAASPIVEEAKTPLANLTECSCGESWHLSSGDKSANVEPVRKYKRLRKAVDREISKDLQLEENIVFPVTNLARTFSGTIPIQNKHSRGKKKQGDSAREFIEEEAEVSSEAEVSADEEDDQDNESYDDSFIDDRINPTAATTQAESSGVDMMAIYRRSLLSQSPMLRHRNTSATPSPERAFSQTRVSGSATSSWKTLQLHTVSTSYTESTEHLSVYKNSESFQINRKRISSDATMPCTTIETSNRNAENRKRKMSFYQPGLTPGINLEKEFSFQSEATTKDTNQQDQVNNNIHTNGDTVDDDQFYECLDLDAIEEQAALLLRQKSDLLTQKQEIPNSQIEAQNPDALDLPSFDLGI